MAPRLPLLVFVLACVAAIAFLPAVAEAKKKNKPPVPALIYYINQTTPACTKKTTYPAWMCTPSPFKFFTCAPLHRVAARTYRPRTHARQKPEQSHGMRRREQHCGRRCRQAT